MGREELTTFVRSKSAKTRETAYKALLSKYQKNKGVVGEIYQNIVLNWKNEGIDMRDYITLRTGMTEAEVLYKFGPSDHETIRSDRLDFILSKTWFYIPDRSDSEKWITEIKFDSNGRLIKRERYRVK